MTIHNTILVPTIFILFCLTACTQKTTELQPNIIVIMADDLGYGGIGCYGNTEISTPCLDSLAAGGLRFTDFHANAPVCSPTRAALLTGRYQQKSGLEGVIYVRGETRATGLDTSETTLAEVLKEAGYQTGMMGKWHLGYDQKYNPVYHGFDEFYGYRSGNIDYHSHYDNAGIYDWYHNLDTISEKGYVTDLITKHAVEFIEKNQESPFFLYVAHEAPHVPFQGRDDPAYRFPGQEFPYLGIVEDRHRAYREMVEVMDEGIGAIHKKLEALNLEENTLLFFISDNGGLRGYGHNDPLHGAKGGLYEGGHRVPAIAYWPGTIMPGTSDALLMTFDLFPTCMAIAGMDRAADLDLDGTDFLPVLMGTGSLQERDLFWRYRRHKAVRSGKMKLLVTQQDTLLFDLETDLEEENNLAAAKIELKQNLAAKLHRWEEMINDYELKTD